METLLGKYGEEGNKLIFKILKRGEHEHTREPDLALRYDLTVPLARVVAQYQNELPKFFKRYQIQPVWRADRPAKGRFREFFQCDIDAIGSTSPVVEAEILGAISEILIALGFADFMIRLNHRAVLSAGIPEARQADALVAIDKLDKIGVDGVTRELAARGIDARAAEQCLLFMQCGPAERPDAIIARLGNTLVGHLAVVELATIAALAESTPAAGRIRIDPSLARGLSYYTGAIMEVSVPDLAGSLGGGGRYDNLIGMFLGRDVPACGFSLGLERIIVVMTERNMFPASVAGGGVDVLVTIWNDETRADALALAGELRRAGLRVDVYPEADKLGKQFKYASSRSVPFVAIVGDDERSRGEVAVKDLRTGEQKSVPRANAAAYLRTQNVERRT
ncbi:MAG: histidine--tRNA ligase [Acidobacteria bacterium]|nr:MAG: histidine--tRNA ligase [Acidobacteriota bacterium]